MNLNIICHGNKYIDLVANQQNENQNDKLEKNSKYDGKSYETICIRFICHISCKSNNN